MPTEPNPTERAKAWLAEYATTDYDEIREVGSADIWIDDAASIIRDLLSAQAWRPIETAPKDGTTIFGTNNRLGQRGMVSFQGGEWEMVDGLTNLPMGVGFYPTHWQPIPSQPLPSPPEGQPS